MKNKKTLDTLNVIVAVLLMVAGGANVFDLITGQCSGIQKIGTAALMLACLFGVYYILAGCKKEGGKEYFKGFLFLIAGSALFLCIGAFQEKVIVIGIMLAVSLAALLVLALGKDLGEKKSVTCAYIVIAMAILRMIIAICQGAFAGVAIRACSEVLLSVATLLLIFSKYADKATRGSK